MNDLSEEEYKSVRASVLDVIDSAKSLKRIAGAYCFNRDIPSHEKLDREHFPIAEYMRELDRCDYFIAVISKRVHSSIYFEAGYALANGKQCVFFCPETLDVLPTIMKSSAEMHPNIRSIGFSDLNDVIYKLRQMTPHFK